MCYEFLFRDLLISSFLAHQIFLSYIFFFIFYNSYQLEESVVHFESKEQFHRL